jgi:mannosylglucosylglycerate synthase
LAFGVTAGQAPRLGMLHYSCPPIVGGVEAILATHARLFLDEGYPVAAIVARGGRFDRRIHLRQIPIIDSRFDELELINTELRRGEVSTRFNDLVERIDAALSDTLADIDVCIVHNAVTLHFNLPLTVALDRIARRGGTRLIAWCHDLSWTNPLYLPLMQEREPWTLLKSPISNTDYVCVSEFRAEELGGLFGGRAPVTTIHNGIDASRFLGLGRATQQLLTQIHASRAFPFLLLPARITRRKNIEQGVRIVAAMAKAGVLPLLLVTGPPGPHNPRSIDYVDEIVRLADSLNVSDRVLLLHRLRRSSGRGWSASDEMMRDLYRVADALLFPSAQEGFGLPVLEAGLARLPAFCANIEPFQDVAGDHLHYFELDEEPDVTANRILQILERDHGAQLHRIALSKYDWNTIFHQQLRPLVDAAAGGPITDGVTAAAHV